MTLFELFYGVARSDQPERKRRVVEEVLGSKPIEPANTAVLRRAGRWVGELANEGTPVSDADVIIGATAIDLDEPVLTRNVGDFERMDVAVETY